MPQGDLCLVFKAFYLFASLAMMNFHFVYHDVRSHAPSLDGSFPDESHTIVYFDNSESFHVQHHDGHSRVKLQSTSIFY
ncbi:hypothetical protein CEXT_558411 [Caerostris extrusa]|uniref:Uncharacterized protein n=1 Tax=Caerostris extrusa TaxID=172846 RepID=A0AAV4TRR9_CAEEX|nr:hypothetical protein CEXT_558411 [Caerostris extrusa]